MEHNPLAVRRPKVALETMGCKLNLADTALLAQDFVRTGYEVVSPTEADSVDVFVLNTCTVTHVADRKARHLLRAARRRFPDAYMVATGCYAQRVPEELSRLSEIDLVAGNTSKPTLVDLVTEGFKARGRGSADFPPLLSPDTDLPPRATFLPHQTRAFVKIQEGCNDYCSYCIIPKTRGQSRSFSADPVVAEVRAKEAAGYQEVVLTGTQLGDYGIDSPGSRGRGPDRRDQATQGEPLATLLARILRETAIRRIRLSSLQPQDVTPGLLELWHDPRLCPHVHLPLQSGSDAVLREMRRRYTAQEYEDAMERIRAEVPDVSITTDVIVGFPGETAADFDATLALCRSLRFADMHVFPFSPRSGTLAARLKDNVPDRIKQERVRLLLDLAQAGRASYQERFLGSMRPVLWEEEKVTPEVAAKPVWHGLTDNYMRVFARGSQELNGKVLATRLAERVAHGIWGEVGQ